MSRRIFYRFRDILIFGGKCAFRCFAYLIVRSHGSDVALGLEPCGRVAGISEDRRPTDISFVALPIYQ